MELLEDLALMTTWGVIFFMRYKYIAGKGG